MPAPNIPSFTNIPNRATMSEEQFAAAADTTVSEWNSVITAQNDLGDYMDALAVDVDADKVAAAESATSASESLDKTVTTAALYTERHQGAHPSAPATRNDGSPLQAGDFYFNTTELKTFTWDGA